MQSRHLAVMTGLVALGLSVTAPAADDAASVLDQRFGQELERVSETPEGKDDIQLARRMIETASEEGQENPALGRLLCERAAELAERQPSGETIRIDALRQLARLDPRDKTDVLSTAASLAQRRYRIADEGQRQQLGQTLIGLLAELAAAHEEDGEREVARLYYRQAMDTAEEMGSDRKREIREAMHQLEIADQIEKLRARLDSDPTDHEAADKLMRLYVVERDAPKKADEFYFSADDKELKQHVSLASRSPQSLSGDERLALGRWYRELIDSASKWAKPTMRRRAQEYYQLFLDNRSREDEAYRKAAAALESLKSASQAETKLADASDSGSAGNSATAPDNSRPDAPPEDSAPADGSSANGSASMEKSDGSEGQSDGAASIPAEPSGDGWTALMSKITPAKLTRQGVWEMDGGELVGKRPTPAQLILPMVPSGDYELRVQFTRSSPIGAAVLHLTIDGRAVLVRLGDRRRRQRDHVAGLSMINGAAALDNDTTESMGEDGLETNKRYTVRARVEKEDVPGTKIKVWLDEKPLLSWDGYSSSLDVAKAWKRIPDDALGLGVDAGGTIRFHSVHLKMLNGEQKPFGD